MQDYCLKIFKISLITVLLVATNCEEDLLLDNNFLNLTPDSTMSATDGTLYTRPILVLGPKDDFVVRNKPATLTCRALHAIRIRFKCNNQWVESEQHVIKEGIDTVSGLPYVEGSVPIHRKQVEEYFGFDGFQCECYASSHKDGPAIKSDKATVKVAYLRKHFYRTPSSESVPLGNTVQLPCLPPDGEPRPQVFWMHNGVEVNRGVDSNVILANDGSLIISAARFTDAGQYVCGARNEAAKKLTKSAVLGVYVDGGWSSWSPWNGSCLVDCADLDMKLRKYRMDKENGMSPIRALPTLKRKRLCNSPQPQNEGKSCIGADVEHMDCPISCPVDGSWTDWDPWSDCSEQCLQFRSRDCNDPKPLNGGRPCRGEGIETKNCTAGLCKGSPYGRPPLAANPQLRDHVAMYSGLAVALLLLAGVVSLILWLVCCKKKKGCCKNGKERDDVYYAGSQGHLRPVYGQPDLTQTLLHVDDIRVLKGAGSVVSNSTLMTPARQAFLNGYGSQGYAPGATPLPEISTFSLRSKSSGGTSSNGYGTRMIRDNLRNMSAMAGSKAALLEGSSSQSSHPPSLDSSEKHRCGSRSSGANSEEHYATLYDYDTPHELLQRENRPTPSPTPSTVDRTSRILDSRGGKVVLQSCGVTLTVPDGALEVGQTEEFTIAVSRQPEEGMRLDGDTTLLSPVITCGPIGLALKKPLVVSVPHCAKLDDDACSWDMQLMTFCDGEEDEEGTWVSAVSLGKETINTNFYCQLDSDTCHIMTDFLCRMALVGSAATADPLPVKKTKLAAFAPLYPSALDYSLRLYCVEDTPAAVQSVEMEEDRLGGYMVADTRDFACQAQGDLCLCVEDISPGWQVKPGANYQEIPFSHLWCCSTAAGGSALHCSFSLELTSDVKEGQNLSARIVAYQKGNERRERQILMINTAMIHEHISPYNRSESAARTLVTMCSSPSSRTSSSSNPRTHVHRPSQPSSSSFLIPRGVKQRICAVLDSPTSEENDWRLLAKKLEVDRYIQYFGQRPSPTEHILNLWEARESDSTSLTHLLQILRSMGRTDAVIPLEAYISQHPFRV